MKIKKFKLNEGTTSYFPGYADDGTSDYCGDIMEKLSPEVEKKIILDKDKIIDYPSSNDFEKAINIWFWCNIILTLGQRGFIFSRDTIENVYNLLQEALNISKNCTISHLQNYEIKSKQKFENQLPLIISELKKTLDSSGTIYLVSFMHEYE